MLFSLALLTLLSRTSALPRPPSPRFTLPTFSSPNASTYLVPPSSLPLLSSLSLQPSYAGLLPVSPTPSPPSSSSDTRELFFWYWPSSAPSGSPTLTIWLNGGPGCSSLEGWMQETGPVRWEPGEAGAGINEWAWTGVSDVLFVEQPVGTGFSRGTPDITDETGLADEFYGFLQQFYSVFPELVSKPLYIAGESYAGMYIPYIATRILSASSSEQSALPLKLQGLLINDGVYSSSIVSEEAPTARFAASNQATLGLTDAQIKTLTSMSISCGYESLLNLTTYPATKEIPLPNGNEDVVMPGCDVYGLYYNYMTNVNPCFNVYRITDKCPTPVDPIEPYFSRADVQAALHVPTFGQWMECTSGNVFLNGNDNSAYSQTLLPNLIESLPAGVHLWHGLLDSVLFLEGDRLTIQNMTWNGVQGFSEPPSTPLMLDGKQMGAYRSERGLTYMEVDNAGHMIPQDQPAVALHVFSSVLGLTTL